MENVEKKVVLTALLFCAAMLLLIAYAAFALGISVPTCLTDAKPFTQGSVTQTAPGRYEAHVVAKMWAFKPDRIKVPAGSTVDFYITSTDVVHGFYIEKTNVNLMALPSVVNFAQARFAKAGKYQILCHEFCGTGHQEMYGTIEVTP